MAKGIDLDREAERPPFLLTKLYDAIEWGLPILVAGKIIVRDEESGDALRDVRADERFNVVCGPASRPATLHVDDCAERALEGAAPPGVEARGAAHDSFDLPARNHRQGSAFQMRKIVDEIIQGLQLASEGIPQYALKSALGLPSENGYAEIHHFPNAGIVLR